MSVLRGPEDKTWSKWPQEAGWGVGPAFPITSRCLAQARAEEAEKHRVLQKWMAETTGC